MNMPRAMHKVPFLCNFFAQFKNIFRADMTGTSLQRRLGRVNLLRFRHLDRR